MLIGILEFYFHQISMGNEIRREALEFSRTQVVESVIFWVPAQNGLNHQYPRV
ncbi:hypothetical protein BC751_3917 [Cecembia calidifontis]|uniref:Uncharacterized protein n=1 Tax=Cecembia calidifontis TaxID=1187080 RepID=A0A4Q7PDE3_9BACT|nr:hypothetical protein BC751_3917 [Cecembia calidifontis]